MLYAAASRCFKSCASEPGYYEVYKNADGYGNCDRCQTPCAACRGDKQNCTWCQWDAKLPGGSTPALFVSKQSQKALVPGGDPIVSVRGSCYKACPNGYFINNQTTGATKINDAGVRVPVAKTDLRYRAI